MNWSIFLIVLLVVFSCYSQNYSLQKSCLRQWKQLNFSDQQTCNSQLKNIYLIYNDSCPEKFKFSYSSSYGWNTDAIQCFESQSIDSLISKQNNICSTGWSAKEQLKKIKQDVLILDNSAQYCLDDEDQVIYNYQYMKEVKCSKDCTCQQKNYTNYCYTNNNHTNNSIIKPVKIIYQIAQKELMIHNQKNLLIIIIVVPCVIVLLFLLVMIFYCCKKRTNQIDNRRQVTEDNIVNNNNMNNIENN